MAASASQQPVSAEVVGNAFVQQYYHMLHHSPALVHKFYQEISKLGRPEVGGSMSITTTMDAINEKLLSLGYSDMSAEISSVDAQESLNGGVQVLVTGYLTGKDNMMRNFSQCFFLAPQDRGYFVLNDMFRYIENGNQPDESQVPVNDVADLVTPEQSPLLPPVQDNHVSDGSNHENEVTEDEVHNPPESEDVPVEEEVAVDEVVDDIQDDSQVVVESEIKVEEVQKKSYASIVKHLKESGLSLSSPTPAPQKSPQKSQEPQANPTPAPATDGQVAISDASDNNGNNQEGEADGYSIYIKGLPMNATVSLLENEFKKFGPIKSGGIQVRSNRQQGFCFGFVEFEVPSAVEKALEASPIAIGGRQAVVEEKRSTNSRGSNRGRFQAGRGPVFRNDGFRGRGGYGSGRGYNRTDFNGRGDFNGRVEFNNRGGNHGRPSSRGGDGYQRADSNGGRTNRTGNGGMANGTSRAMAPRVSVTA